MPPALTGNLPGTKIENPSTASPGTSSCRKRKAVDLPEDLNQDKKIRNLQKQLQASKQKAKEYKEISEDLKESFGISPFNGKSGFSRCYSIILTTGISTTLSEHLFLFLKS